MRQVEFFPYHLSELTLQRGQQDELREGEEALLSNFDNQSYTWVDDGNVVACAGIIDLGGRGVAWALISNVGASCFVRLHRDVSAILSAYEGVLEAHVDESFDAARRWVKLLGFEETDGGAVVNGIKYIKCIRNN